MIAFSNVPTPEFFESQGLKLHYADWGNRDAPPLILIHGGRDHCRSWDWIAGALKDDFHVIAPDLRGHGDSDWAKGSSYSLADHVYDLTRLLHSAGIRKASIVGHSMGGMVSLTFAGAFPERMSSLVVLDGVTTLPSQSPRSIDRKMSDWTADLDRIAGRTVRRYSSVAEAAQRIMALNARLSMERALHLASHGLKGDAEIGYTWKFDQYVRARAPYRMSLDDNIALWSRIACSTLFLCGGESSLTDPRTAGVFENFSNAELLTIEGAGHWLHHDKPDEMIRHLRAFLDALGNDEGEPTTSSQHRS